MGANLQRRTTTTTSNIDTESASASRGLSEGSCASSSAAMTRAYGDVMKIDEIIHGASPRLLVLFDQGEEDIVRVMADVVGQSFTIREAFDEVYDDEYGVVGIDNASIGNPEDLRGALATVIMTHCLDLADLRDEAVAACCDYEYLYTHGPGDVRRDIARYLGFILGQTRPHDALLSKPRTFMLSTTFPDIRVALPNLDILSVGADAVELRVDLLEDPYQSRSAGPVPGIKYVGEQVMLLRQRTELPIVFSTRCTRENGRFPMDDPGLFYTYLHKARQWGCEYLDVELWLPEDIRRRLAAEKGSSKIMSAWHDFSGDFRWSAPEALTLFQNGAVYADIVKMIAYVHRAEDNYELEYFRSMIQTKRVHPPLSGLNMGGEGQLSRMLNPVFTPVTHPLLPMIAAPGQLSTAEINARLHSMGQLPELELYAVGSKVRTNGQAMFFEKCLNELSLPHRLRYVESHRPTPSSFDITEPAFITRPRFGGAYMNPPVAVNQAAASPYQLTDVSEAAKRIGQIDTIVAHHAGGGHGKTFQGDNVTWKGVRSTLLRDYVPSAYAGRPAIVLATREAPAAAAIYALNSLGVAPIYTIGFQAQGELGARAQHCRDIEDMRRLPEPFVIISALPADKSMTVVPLLKHSHLSGRQTKGGRLTEGTAAPERVFVDLSNGIHGKGDSVSTATSLGWRAYGVADVNAWTTVETLRLLVGQNVPFDFVRLAAGRSLYA